MTNVAPVILAAGRGTRMRSGLAKSLHVIGGAPLVEHVVRTVSRAGLMKPWVVVGFQGDRVEETLEGMAHFVTQPELKGTGDAVLRSLDVLPPHVDHVLVLVGDCPLVPEILIRQLVEHHVAMEAACTIVSTIMPDPTGYGRVIRGEEGDVRAIVEHREASEGERSIQEINTGLGIWRVDGLRSVLESLPWHNDERYLTEVIRVLVDNGERVEAVVASDPTRVMGINTRKELAEAEGVLRQFTLERLFDAGVTIVDPGSTYVDADVEIGQDTVLYPMTFIRGNTKIGRECHIGPMTELVSSRLSDGVVVDRSVVENSVLAAKVKVGPFSHLRSGTYLDRDVKIGNFVELKNTRVGIGSKAGHHAYLGDATIGGRVNIGAGTVIVNYDGITKHPTFIGDEVFVGCNSNLVAPLEIGPGAYVAAGSTVTQNIPAEALGIARSRQENKPEWAKARRLNKGKK